MKTTKKKYITIMCRYNIMRENDLMKINNEKGLTRLIFIQFLFTFNLPKTNNLANVLFFIHIMHDSL